MIWLTGKTEAIPRERVREASEKRVQPEVGQGFELSNEEILGWTTNTQNWWSNYNTGDYNQYPLKEMNMKKNVYTT